MTSRDSSPSSDASGRKFVAVATARTLPEADIIRARLEAEGILVFIPSERMSNIAWHMLPAIQPCGIPVMVPADRAEQALQVIAEASRPADWDEELTGWDGAEAPGGEPTANGYAERAHRSAFLAFFTLVLVPVTFYLYVLARRTSRTKGVWDRRRYRRHMRVALWLGIILPLFIVFVGLIALISRIPVSELPLHQPDVDVF